MAPVAPPPLQPGGTVELEFSFQVRSGEPVDLYEFELAIVDSYSGATLARKLTIPSRSKEESRPFANGIEFAPPDIQASIALPDGSERVAVCDRETVRLTARVKTPDGDPFKAWIFNSVVGDHSLPDKIFFADSKGEAKLDVSAEVTLKKGTNSFTVVATDRDGIDSRQSVFVRRE
jgi:hypothetical protein